MRFSARLLSAIALVAALSAQALSAQAEIRGVLYEPRDGEVLRGGATAVVSWSAQQLPRFVDEWEAFLSVDGGRYYAYRITPHLDIALRQFTFEVPNVETTDARILIRAGNEGREVEVETSQTFVIRQDFARAITVPPLEVREHARGEAARAGDRGVIAWIEGRRDGSHLRKRDALQRRCTLSAHRTLTAPLETVEEAGGEEVSAPQQAAASLTLASTLQPACAAARHRTGREVLLSCRRLNI